VARTAGKADEDLEVERRQRKERSRVAGVGHDSVAGLYADNRYFVHAAPRRIVICVLSWHGGPHGARRIDRIPGRLVRRP
jgi:hypothetical protein